MLLRLVEEDACVYPEHHALDLLNEIEVVN